MNKKKTFTILLKYCIGIYLLIWIINNNNNIDLKIAEKIDYFDIVLLLFFSLSILILTSWRVKILLDYKNIKISMKDCTIYNCIGLFFSTFLPGGLSGDAVRVFYFWKNKNSIESDKSVLVGCLLFDRLIGMFSLLLSGLIAFTIIYKDLGISSNIILLCWLSFLILTLTFIFFSYFINLFSPKSNHRFFTIFTSVKNVISNINFNSYDFSTLFFSFSLCLLINVFSALIIYTIANSYKSGLDLIEILFIVPATLIINFIPLTPGGIGIGEKAFDILASLFGGINGVEIFLYSRIVLYLPALFGGIYYFFIPKNKK